MANGRPSRRRHSATTVSRSNASTPTVELTAAARRMNNRTAGASGSALASGGTRTVCSPSTSSDSRLVASTTDAPGRERNASANSAQASTRCSQLSRINRRSLSSRNVRICPSTSPAVGVSSMP